MRYFVGDFETTSYKGQTKTEVWASAVVELGTEKVLVTATLDETWEYLNCLNDKLIIYYHNLKFDGSFWLSFLNSIGYRQAYVEIKEIPRENQNIEDALFEPKTPKVKFKKRLFPGEYSYMISANGLWYSIRIVTPNVEIELRDSLKLFPLSVEELGKAFNTKHRKAVDEHGKSIEYNKYREAGGPITPEEMHYIKNDVLVVKEALETMFSEGHDKLTIGSCCMSEYKKIYKERFGRTIEEAVNHDLLSKTIWLQHAELAVNEMRGKPYGTSWQNWTTNIKSTVYDYVYKSYRGGWVYLADGKARKVYKNGITLDVNSLYPSVMHSDLGYKYPIEYILQWRGNYIPDCAHKDNRYFFVRFKCRFYLKEGKLPTVQIKKNFLYPPREMLKNSDVYDKKYNRHYRYKFPDGTDVPLPILIMTETDYKLFLEHYDVEDFEILDGVVFRAEVGIFDEYIDKYAEMKRNSKGGRRQIAKLFLNNLYGKMAANIDSSFKVVYMKDDGALGFKTIMEFEKKPGYIPIGSAITSYARCFTIRAAQANYHGPDNPGFIYADTDSLHMDISEAEAIGVKIHDSDFGCWKCESEWDEGYFVRAKTYIEKEGEKYNITCAGLPKKCKKLLAMSLSGEVDIDFNFEEDEEREFASKKRKLEDFKPGIEIPGKLHPKQIPGGVILESTYFTMT